MPAKKELIRALLKGIETGDPQSVAIVNEDKYIQHNPLTKTGNVGLAELFKRLSKMNPKVEIVRVFEDGEFVFAHTDYNFNEEEIGFEVFRFENGLVVEHWDNLQLKPQGPNLSGHTMLDGEIAANALENTEESRSLIHSFIDTVFLDENFDRLEHFVDSESYIEHNPDMADGIEALRETLVGNEKNRRYDRIHRLLSQGNFTLCVSEGSLDGVSVSFYDLFRIDNGKIVEHWDTVDKIPPRDQWLNNNGKF